MAETLVNRELWGLLGTEGQRALMEELIKDGTLQAGEHLIPSEDAPGLAAFPTEGSDHASNGTCENIRDAAFVQCQARFGGDGKMLIACKAVAGYAYLKCLSGH